MEPLVARPTYSVLLGIVPAQRVWVCLRSSLDKVPQRMADQFTFRFVPWLPSTLKRDHHVYRDIDNQFHIHQLCHD